MSFKARRIVTLSFMLTTLVLTAVTAYTIYTYMGIYKATRDFDLIVQSFTVKVLNSTDALIKTAFTIQNPSEFSFRVLHMQQILYLNNDYFWNDHMVFPKQDPMYISPFSNVNMTFDMSVPTSKIHLVSQPEGQDWFMIMTLLLEGPMVGIFDFNKYEIPHSV